MRKKGAVLFFRTEYARYSWTQKNETDTQDLNFVKFCWFFFIIFFKGEEMMEIFPARHIE